MYLTLNVSVVLLILLANYAERHSGLRLVVYALLSIGDFILCAAGLVALGLAWLSITDPGSVTVAGGASGMGALGGSMLAIGLLGGVVLLPAVRRRIALVLDIEPNSCVHATALALAAFSVGFGVLQGLLWTKLSEALPPAIAVTPLDLVATSVFMLAVALTGVGFLVRRSAKETASRLGMRRLERKHLLLVAVMIGAFLVMDLAVGWLWQSFGGESFELAQEAMGTLLGALLTPLGALAVGVVAGTGEEILFRGALQPRFGLWLTALLFTLAHFQYAFSPGMVEVLVLGLALGYLRRRVGTIPCILVHAGYNLADMAMLMLTGAGA